MTWRLLDYNPVTKVKTWHEYDYANKKNVLRYEQPTQAILDTNHEIEANGHKGWVDSEKTMKLVARVPIVLLYQWARETGTKIGSPEFQDVLRIRLNDPEYRKVRTCPGGV